MDTVHECLSRSTTVFNSTNASRSGGSPWVHVTRYVLGWTSRVRMVGITVGRDFPLRAVLITYPLPASSGEAADR
ncbi:hypothetical protein ER21_12740 [Cronobacter sakazakii]|nr:hypothetical protein ER21_12740 [Cronobacter sakazakii]